MKYRDLFDVQIIEISMIFTIDDIVKDFFDKIIIRYNSIKQNRFSKLIIILHVRLYRWENINSIVEK